MGVTPIRFLINFLEFQGTFSIIKRLDTTANPALSSVVDILEPSLHCSWYKQATNSVEIGLSNGAIFQKSENKEIAAKRFWHLLN